MTRRNISLTDDEVIKKLEDMAEAESRSLAGVVARLVKEAPEPKPKDGRRVQVRGPQTA